MNKKKEYAFIAAWGRMIGSYAYYIQDEQERAQQTDAPEDATFYREEGGWRRLSGCTNSDTLWYFYLNAHDLLLRAIKIAKERLTANDLDRHIEGFLEIAERMIAPTTAADTGIKVFKTHEADASGRYERWGYEAAGTCGNGYATEEAAATAARVAIAKAKKEINYCNPSRASRFPVSVGPGCEVSRAPRGNGSFTLETSAVDPYAKPQESSHFKQWKMGRYLYRETAKHVECFDTWTETVIDTLPISINASKQENEILRHYEAL